MNCVSKKFFESILARERTSIYRLDRIGSHQCQPDIETYLVLRLEYILSQEDSCVIAVPTILHLKKGSRAVGSSLSA